MAVAITSADEHEVARDLRRAFGERYRIVRGSSGDEALEMLRELVARGDQVALLVADHRMPGMAGTDYLVAARQLVPGAKRVLLTAYADTAAAIQAINEVALDYYLLKPWDPPEEQLYPVVEDLLTTWESGAALDAGGVRLIGHRFSKDSHDLRDFLARNRVPARWLDVERDGEARELLTVAGVGDGGLPVALLEDGSLLERPTVLELAERLGVAARPASAARTWRGARPTRHGGSARSCSPCRTRSASTSKARGAQCGCRAARRSAPTASWSPRASRTATSTRPGSPSSPARASTTARR